MKDQNGVGDNTMRVTFRFSECPIMNAQFGQLLPRRKTKMLQRVITLSGLRIIGSFDRRRGQAENQNSCLNSAMCRSELHKASLSTNYSIEQEITANRSRPILWINLVEILLTAPPPFPSIRTWP